MNERYTLLHPTQPNSGMFAFIWQTIRGMYHYPNDKYYILFGNESCYYDTKFSDENCVFNVWDYYFEQPHTPIIPAFSEIDREVGLLFDEFSEFRDLYIPKDVYAKRRDEYNEIINKNVKLLPHMLEKIESFYEKNFKDKNIIGIHCRGADHPEKLDIDFLVNSSAEYIDKYDLAFVTSDQQEYIDAFRYRFGDKIITYNVGIRSTGNTPLHYANGYDYSKHRIGEDAIIEAYLLSKTNFLLCAVDSNVNYFVRALNNKIPYNVIKKYDTN
jgi:hypothetical protein